MKYVFAFTIALMSQMIFAHDANYENVIPKQWQLKNGKTINGFFFMCKNAELYLEQEDQKMVHIPLKELSSKDREFVDNKMIKINQLNKKLKMKESSGLTEESTLKVKPWILIFIAAATVGLVFFKYSESKLKYFEKEIQHNGSISHGLSIYSVQTIHQYLLGQYILLC